MPKWRNKDFTSLRITFLNFCKINKIVADQNNDIINNNNINNINNNSNKKTNDVDINNNNNINSNVYNINYNNFNNTIIENNISHINKNNIKKNKNIKNRLLKKRNFQNNNYSLISNYSKFYNITNSKVLFNEGYIVTKINQKSINKNNKKFEENIIFIDIFINKFYNNYINKINYEKKINKMKCNYVFKMDIGCSLLKQKQLLLFRFFDNNDYNINLMKISLFLYVFSLYLMINTFFFNDDNIHKIYEDNGKYNFIFQIPQILYSTIISSIITTILKSLTLYQKSIIKIKEINNINLIIKTFLSSLKSFKYKIILFNIIGLIILLFNLYYISLFCAVYTNTQSHLLTNTYTSFGISLLYPFGLSRVHEFLRISVLESGKNNIKIVYIISRLISIL